jgi:hypothetical protein
MVGNDANLDILQLISRLAGTTEISNILARYPHWDRTPRRLKLYAISRESKSIPDSADHIKPAAWRGNVEVKDVSLQTSWNRGRRIVKEECGSLEHVLQELDQLDNVDILSPFGTLLVKVPLAADDIDDSLEFPSFPEGVPTAVSGNGNADSDETRMRVEVEDALGELADVTQGGPKELAFEGKIRIQGVEVSKARALSRFNRLRKHTGSTDRLKRVQDMSRFVENKSNDQTTGPPTDDSETVVISDPIATLIRVEDKFWLCLGEVNAIRIDGQSVGHVSFDMLTEAAVIVSYQMLGLRPATLDDDPEGWHDWRTYTIGEQSFTVPGQLIQSINPTISKTHNRFPFYLLQSSVLVALTASLFQTLAISNLKKVPNLTSTKEYPYREGSGESFTT